MASTPRVTTSTSRDFNQDASGAKRAAEKGPVYITDRGRPAHVLLSIDEYRRPTEPAASIVDLSKMPLGEVIDFDPATLQVELRLPDLG